MPDRSCPSYLLLRNVILPFRLGAVLWAVAAEVRPASARARKTRLVFTLISLSCQPSGGLFIIRSLSKARNAAETSNGVNQRRPSDRLPGVVA